MDTDRSEAVTVLVVTYRGRAFLEACLDSLASQTTAHRVLIVDNASTDGTEELLADRYPHVDRLRLPSNVGFAGGVAAGLRKVTTPWCALLNDDAIADPRWLEALTSAVNERPEVAAATSRMLLAPPDGSGGAELVDMPSTGDVVNNLGVALNRHGFGYDIGLGLPAPAGFTRTQAVFGFSGGASLINISAVENAGGFPSHFFLYYEDTDLSWRLRLLGYEVVTVPAAIVWHRHSATVDNTSKLFHYHNERNRLLMLLRCATSGFALNELLRFMLTTASLTVKRMIRWPVPDAANARPGLRLRVLVDVCRTLRSTLRQRGAIQASALVPTDLVQQWWIGFDPLVTARSESAQDLPGRTYHGLEDLPVAG